MRNEAPSARRVISIALMVLLVFAVAFVIAGCASAGKYKIDYGKQKSDYDNPPTSADPGEEVEITCITEVTDAGMVFYVDDERVDAEYQRDHSKVIRFTMPDHDVIVKYRIEADPAGAGA